MWGLLILLGAILILDNEVYYCQSTVEGPSTTDPSCQKGFRCMLVSQCRNKAIMSIRGGIKPCMPHEFKKHICCPSLVHGRYPESSSTVASISSTSSHRTNKRCVLNVENGIIGRYEFPFRDVRVFTELAAGTSIENDDDLTLLCNDNYKAFNTSNAEGKLHCRNGEWVDVPWCELERCEVPNVEDGLIGRYVTHSGNRLFIKVAVGTVIEDDDSLILLCDSKHRPPGSLPKEELVRCRKNKWVNIPSCESGQCFLDKLSSPGLVQRSKTVYESGESFRPTCEKGYQLVSPSSRLTCVKGNWVGSMPPCAAANCTEEPPGINHGFAKPHNTMHTAFVSYECYGEYYLEESEKIQCLYGEWKGTPPTCKDTVVHNSFWAPPCDPTICVLPDCFCGTSIPGKLRSDTVPQMITITFNGAVNGNNIDIYDRIFKNGRNNPNGCSIKGTFFVSHKFTNYSEVQELHRKGHEIAVHSVTHTHNSTYWTQASYDTWTKEMAGVRIILEHFSNITDNSIAGVRAPYLKTDGHNQFTMMEEQAFLYDSTIVASLKNPPLWPYTLYFRMPHKCRENEQICPTRSYAVWEMVINELDQRNNPSIQEEFAGCDMIDSCQNIISGGQLYKFLTHNFQRHYESNRAPLGLHFHASWLKQKDFVDALAQWIDEILAKKDVYFVTMTQVQQWIQSPTELYNIKNFAPWNEKCVIFGSKSPFCLRINACPSTTKELPGETIRLHTCMKCPPHYPWLENPNGE